MAASQDECIAAYVRTQVCLDRTYSRLLGWAAYITAQPMPPTDTAPEKAWIQQRILAERTPQQATGLAIQVGPYMLETPSITDVIRDHLNAYNDEAMETTLVAGIDSSLAVVMPKYAAYTISDRDVAAWCDKNGYPRPPGLAINGMNGML